VVFFIIDRHLVVVVARVVVVAIAIGA